MEQAGRIEVTRKRLSTSTLTADLKANKNGSGGQSLRATDQETARVVAIHRRDGLIVGAGCLLNHRYILTCLHVVRAAIGDVGVGKETGEEVYVTLAGLNRQRTISAAVLRVGQDEPQNDLALLGIPPAPWLGAIDDAEFASPLRHGGKSYSVLGFPNGDPQGRNAVGLLHAADTKGLVQMDRGGALSVLGGFSGAPVWSTDLRAFVGLVVTELAQDQVAWCIPSRRLCEFFPDLRVRFRIPKADRPIVHDLEIDDPNLQLFGRVSETPGRKLSAHIRERTNDYVVSVFYTCKGSVRPRGHFVSFITYPGFGRKGEDAYELFDELHKGEHGCWAADQEFRPWDLFTVAAIGDGGDTVLTLDLEEAFKRQKKRT